MGRLATGTLFAGHRIEGVVGRGGMGMVYRARQLELDRIVALKVVAPELLEDGDARARFVQEARAAAAVEHPHVIPLYYVGEHDGLAFLAMRHIAGADLRTLVSEHGPLVPARAAEIVAQAGTALDAIHAAGFVHRDVKPANLLLAACDHVYLADFGLAKQALARGGPTHSGHWVGTLDYVAPEQIRGGRVDARADVYALGGVLHFMLTAHVPYEQETDEAKLWAHLSEPPPAPCSLRPELPAAFDAVVARALAKDPEERPPSAGDLGRAALAAARGSPLPGHERMVARGAASPEGANRLPGLAEDAPTLTRTGAAPPRAAAVAARPRRQIVAVAVGLVAAAGAAIAVLTHGGGAEHFRVGSTMFDVAPRPNGVAVAGADVWVTSASQEWVTRIEAATGRVRPERPSVGRGALDIAAGPHDVWVAVTPQSTVVRIDPVSGAVVDRVRTPLRPVALAAGATDVWVVGHATTPDGADALLHYAHDGRPLRRVDIAHGISALALGAGAVWIAEQRHARLLRVDPRSGHVRAISQLDSPASALAYGAGYVWVTFRDDDSAARIDPVSRRVVSSAAGHQPAGLALAGGRVLVASQNDDTIVELDPRTGHPIGHPLHVALNPFAVAAGLGHVWVTGLGADTVTRLDRR